MLSRSSFDQEFTTICDSLEARRKRYLFKFKCGIVAAFMTLMVAFAFAEKIMFAVVSIITNLYESVKSIFFSASEDYTEIEITFLDHLSFYIATLVLVGFFILGPIYFYRGKNRSAALKTFRYHRFSLKDEAYSRLFRLFGPIEFAPRGGVSLLETRNSSLFSETTPFLAEDYLVGVLNNITVRVCEANMTRTQDRQRRSIFKGLLIALDTSEVKVKLRRDFSGRTVIVHDPKKELPQIAERYKGMERFVLPEAFEPVLEGYTTDAAEAGAIITSQMLEAIQLFASKLQKLEQQETHWDDKVAHAVSESYAHAKDVAIDIRGKSRLPSEIAYDEKHAVDLDITKADPLCTHVSSLNNHFQLEYFDDKFILTIPCANDLFEPNPLFEPALNKEDAEIVYQLMQMLDAITAQIHQVKSPPQQ